MPKQTERPDFDSMSQDELIRWLDKLARPDVLPDEAAGPRAQEPAAAPLADVPWLDEDEAFDAETPQLPASASASAQLIDDDDDETPTALSALGDAVDDDTTDPLTWTEHAPKRIGVPDAMPQVDETAADPGAADDPLAWLESLAQQINESDSEPPEPLTIADADDDESLFSGRMDEGDGFVDALPGLILDDDEFSTQSLAPLPDFLLDQADDIQPAVDDGDGAQPEIPPTDQLTSAMQMDERMAELEAWYAGRLHALQATEAAPELTQLGQPPMMPPPGLAAGFNSARGKVRSGQLDAALAEYETLLRANIGLDLVVSDMNWLLGQASYRGEPAVHRVLGDALMRRGDLNAALDVYRHAMSLLQEP